MFDLVDEMENNDKIDSANESRGPTSVLGQANNDIQMIDDLFNFNESNEAIWVAPVQETHDIPSSRFINM